MANKKRLYFLRNLEEFTPAELFTKEHEVIADANIVGELTYGPYYFTIWEIAKKREGEERKLCLQIIEKIPSSDDESWRSAKRSGFYHGGGIADELIALAALFLRRRLKLGPVTRIDDKPRLLSTDRDRRIDQSLVSGESNLSELLAWFRTVEGLEEKHQLKFILAVRLYHRALLLIEEQPDLAYLNLISAIEVLCQQADVGEVTLSDIDPKLAGLVSSITSEDLRTEIEQTILKRERFISRRFVSFILDHTEENFWSEESRPQHGQVTREEFPDLLKRAYDQRSKTLHSGEPFPATVFEPPIIPGQEIDLGTSVSVGERKWERQDFIPYPHFFERLVNHVLKSFLKKNQTTNKIASESSSK